MGVKYSSAGHKSVAASQKNTVYKPVKERGASTRHCDPLMGYQNGEKGKGPNVEKKLPEQGKKYGVRE